MKATIRGVILFGLMIFLIWQTNAQQISFEGELSKVDSSGFFQINLTPFVYNRLTQNKSDLRIFDEQNKEVPFIWKEEVCKERDSVKYLEVKGVQFRQHEEKETKRSIVDISLPGAERISSIEIHANGQKYFKRFGQLSFVNYDYYKRRRKRRSNEEFYLELNSEDTLAISIPESKVKNLTLKIENEDNPPLRISEVIIKQKQHQIISYLDKEKSYRISFGGSTKALPTYDLEYFRSKVPKKLDSVEIVNIKKKEVLAKSRSFYEKPAFIWSCIAIVAGVLGFASVRMVKEMNRKGTNPGT